MNLHYIFPNSFTLFQKISKKIKVQSHILEGMRPFFNKNLFHTLIGENASSISISNIDFKIKLRLQNGAQILISKFNSEIEAPEAATGSVL